MDSENIVTKETLTTAQAAKLIDRSSQNIIHWCNSGKIKYQRIGRGPRKVDTKAFREFLIKSGYSVPGFTDRPLVLPEESKILYDVPKIKKSFTANEIIMPLPSKEKVTRLKKIISVLKSERSPESKYRDIECIITNNEPLED